MGCISSAPSDDVIVSEKPSIAEEEEIVAKYQKAKAEEEVISAEKAEDRAYTQLKVIFDSLDTTGDGQVSKKELVTGLEKNDKISKLIKDANLNPNFTLMRNLDKNRDGKIAWDEFKVCLKEAACEEVKKDGDVGGVEMAADEMAIRRLKYLFDGLDTNKNGEADKEELLEGMAKDDNLRKLIEDAGFNTEYDSLDKLDTNKDGKIAWEEFEAHLKKIAVHEVKNFGDLEAARVMEDHQMQDEETVDPNACVCWFVG